MKYFALLILGYVTFAVILPLAFMFMIVTLGIRGFLLIVLIVFGVVLVAEKLNPRLRG